MDELSRSKANAFKVGLLTKLAASGILPSELYERIKKADISDVLGTIGSFGKAVGGGALDAATNVGKYGLIAGTAAPLVLGGAAGIADAKLNAPTPEDIKALQKAELLSLYTRLTREIRERQEFTS